jgi:hypothetical protein
MKTGLRTLAGRLMLFAGLAASASLAFPFEYAVVEAGQSSDVALQGQADAMMKNIEDMIAHGGMGDAKAILHHCGEASRHAEGLLANLPPSDPRRNQASVSLNEVIQHCKRVSEMGIHSDPGLLLNPAIKARYAARESVKILGLQQAKRG